MRRTLVGYLATLALLVSLAGPLALLPASANGTPTKMPSDSGGVIVPTTTPDVRIERELLSFDLTTSTSQAGVKASYDLINVSSKDVSLDALFLAAQGRGLTLSLDGKPLDVRQAEKADLPPEWIASTHGLDPLTGQDYIVDEYLPSRIGTRTWAFRLQLPAGGRATLRAEYNALLGYDRERYKYIVRHLTYVLGPARNWAGFGTLEVAASVPSGYLLVASPGLNKSREENGVSYYEGKFEGIPAELFRISTISAAAGNSGLETPVQDALTMFVPPFLAAILAFAVVLTLLSRLRPRRFLPLLAGCIAAVIVPVVGTVVTLGLAPAPNADSVSAGTFDDIARIMLWFGWTFLVLPVITGVSTGAVLASRNRRKTRTSVS